MFQNLVIGATRTWSCCITDFQSMKSQKNRDRPLWRGRMENIQKPSELWKSGAQEERIGKQEVLGNKTSKVQRPSIYGGCMSQDPRILGILALKGEGAEESFDYRVHKSPEEVGAIRSQQITVVYCARKGASAIEFWDSRT